MVNVRRRLERLEESMRGGGRCPHGLRVVWPPGDGRPPTGPEICPTCGLERPIAQVVYDLEVGQ